jgi:hypothetical protein
MSNELTSRELMDAIEPLLNSIATELGHDALCATGFATPGPCNCSRMEAQKALQALRELGRRAEQFPASRPSE